MADAAMRHPRRASGPTVEPPAKRKQAALAWMRSGVGTAVSDEPVDFASLLPPLDSRLEAVLRRDGVNHLFPVQTAVWEALAGGAASAHDVCVCAPTGSGKTLAYALPVVAALSNRVVCRLRALIVLPTHDLAQQVGGVFAPLCAATGLSLAICSGKGALRPEQALLMDARDCESKVDVLVATPGRHASLQLHHIRPPCSCLAVARLVAHLQSTPGFTLSHLRLLVVDEADRLLRQAYQAW